MFALTFSYALSLSKENSLSPFGIHLSSPSQFAPRSQLSSSKSDSTMFQFGPFGSNKKQQQPVDPVQHLTTLAKTVVDDPSILNQNLREVCQHLGTPLHDKADQLLGTMVASHSSRMLSTLWTVLLQRLRESGREHRAQLAILRHFSMIAYRISIPQRGNAFRVFAREASALCDIEALVADRSFGKSFAAVIQALGVHGEPDLCQALLEKSITAVFSWTRLDARRAASNQVACLLSYSSSCGTFRQLLESIEPKDDAVGKALILDASTAPAIEQGRRLQQTCVSRESDGLPTPLSQHSSLGPGVGAFQKCVASWVLSLVASSTLTPTDATVLPLLVSSLTKLIAADHRWIPENVSTMRDDALRLLQDSSTRKVLVCPLLSLLRALPPASTSDVDTIVAHCKHDDSMTRCEAYGALERVLPILDNDAVQKLVEETLRQHTTWMQERCNVSIRGMLGFLAAAFPRIQSFASAVSSRMVHVLTRAHLDLSNTVNNVPTVQLQMLALLEHTVAYLSAGAIAYILFCTQSNDGAVRGKASDVLLRLCDAATIDRMQLFDTIPRGLDFLENAYSATAGCCGRTDVRDLTAPEVKSSSSSSSISNEPIDTGRFVRNVGVILSYFSHQLTMSCVPSGAGKESVFAVQTCCEAITFLTRSLHERIASIAEWNEVLVPSPVLSCPHPTATPGTQCASTVGTRDNVSSSSLSNGRVGVPIMPSLMVSMFRLLMDFVNSVVTLPIDIVTTVLEAATVCADGCSPTDCFDIYLHKASFNVVWNILHRCCGAMDPLNVPKLHQEPSLYLSHSVLHRSLEALIHQTSQSALSSAERPEETSFYKLTGACIRLLLALSRWGHRSPVFIAHMRHQYRFLLVCLDILASSHPIAALQACHQFFVIMFFEGGGGRHVGHEASFGSSDNDDVVWLSDSVPSIQRTKYVGASVSILNRSLSFDLCHVGPTLFRLMRLYISVDVAAQDASCYRSIDETLSLFRRMSDIASDVSYYNSVVGSSVAYSVLKTLVYLHNSPHAEAVKEVLPVEVLHDRVMMVVKAARDSMGDVALFSDCVAIVQDACKERSGCSTVSMASNADTMDEAQSAQMLCAEVLLVAGRSVLQQRGVASNSLLAECSTTRLASVLRYLCSSGSRASEQSSLTARDLQFLGKVFAEELANRLTRQVAAADNHTSAMGEYHDDLLGEVTEVYLASLSPSEGTSSSSFPYRLWARFVLATLSPRTYLPQLVFEVLDEAGRRKDPNTECDTEETVLFLTAWDTVQLMRNVMRTETFIVAASAIIPPFPAVHPSTLRQGSYAEALLDLCNWEWGEPEMNTSPLWDWWYSPDAHRVAGGLSLLRYLVQQRISVPERALRCSRFWAECIAEYPTLPMVRLDDGFPHDSVSEIHGGDVLMSGDDMMDDPTAMIDSEATKKGDGGDREATIQCVNALRPLLAEGLRGTMLSTSRILSECFVELAPFPIHIGALREVLVPTSSEDGKLTAATMFCVLLENCLLPEDAGAGDTQNVGSEGPSEPSNDSQTAEAALLQLIVGLPKRSLAMKDLEAHHVFNLNHLPATDGSDSIASAAVAPFFRYLGEAVWCVESEERCADLFRSFLSVLQQVRLTPDPELIVGFVNAFIRCQMTMLSVPVTSVAVLLRVCVELLSNADVEDERTLSLRYSTMFLLVLIAPDRELFWQNVVDRASSTTTSSEPAESAEWAPLGPSICQVLKLVLELPDDASNGAGGIAQYTVSIFLRSAALSAGIQESILWMVVKCCPISIWSVICREDLCRSTEMAAIRFLTKMSQTVGMSQHLVQEVHARYTPLLLSFGSSRSEIDPDEQRMVFWLITSLLLHTVISEERHTKPKPHMSLADALYLYVDYPLSAMSLESAVRIRRKADEFMFPFFARMPAASSERNWNLHTRGQLLPVCGRQTLSKAAAEKVFTSILHMYTHVVSSVFENINHMPVEALTDVFFSLGTLCAGNASLLKHSPALEGTIASSVLNHVYGWYRKYCSNSLSSVDSKQNVLNFRVGLFPESSSNLEFTDTFSVVSCANVISSLFVRGNELIPGAVDVSFIMEKLLCMDIVAHQSALSTVIVMSGTSTRKEMSRIAPLFTQRLFRDLDVCCKGSLSTSFGIMSLLRSAFSIVAAIPDDAVAMKVCESVWNGIVVRGMGGRRVQHYAHFVLQSMITMSSVHQTQWRTLRALIQTSEVPQDHTAQSQLHQSSNSSFASAPAMTTPTPPASKSNRPKMSFADGVREKLDKLLENNDENRNNSITSDHLVAIRQTSISAYTSTPGAGSQAPSLGYAGSFSALPSDQQSAAGMSDIPHPQQCHETTTIGDGEGGGGDARGGRSALAAVNARHFAHWTRRLLTLSTTAAAILRSKMDEDHLDHNRIQVMGLLSATEDSPSAAGEVHLFAVMELLHEILDPSDAMFVVLNRFNFAEATLLLFNSEARRAVGRSKAENDEKMASMVALPQMTLFFETALRRLHSAENAWWALANVLLAIMSLWTAGSSTNEQNTTVDRGTVFPLLCLLGARVPLPDLVRITRFAVQKLLQGDPTSNPLATHKKDVKMFIRSLEGTTKTKNASKPTSGGTSVNESGALPAAEAIGVVANWLQ